MSVYKNKYRIESIRLKEWDYSNPWYYYVTINTKKHIHFFGKVANNKMVLNELGKIVNNEWMRTKELRKNVELDYYVIMPNHLHGIIIIDHNVKTTGSVVSKTVDDGKIKMNDVISQNKNESMHRIASTTLKSNSLGSIVGQFKSVCTKQLHSLRDNNFAWQPGFYDRIIRNDKELYKIRLYIQQNPLSWDLEKDLPENLDI